MVNVKPVKLGNTERMSFGKIDEVIDMPNLIDIQKASYKWLLDEGLKEVFKDVSGITDYQDNLVLDFIDYTLDVDHPNYSVIECKVRDATYSAALRVTARLLNKSTGEIKESNVFMGDFPLMTASGTFVINGAERVIVSQLVRSPGVYYKMDHDKTGKELYSTTVIPNRGAWLEYETDVNDVFYVRIDKNRKLPVTSFIRALGLGTDAEILDYFGDDERMRATIEKDAASNVEEGLIEVYKKLRPSEPPTVDSAQTHINNLFFDPGRYDMSRVGRYKYNKKLGIANRLEGQVLAEPIANPRTGEVMALRDEKITKEKAFEIENAGVKIAYVKAADEQSLRLFQTVWLTSLAMLILTQKQSVISRKMFVLMFFAKFLIPARMRMTSRKCSEAVQMSLFLTTSRLMISLQQSTTLTVLLTVSVIQMISTTSATEESAA